MEHQQIKKLFKMQGAHKKMVLMSIEKFNWMCIKIAFTQKNIYFQKKKPTIHDGYLCYQYFTFVVYNVPASLWLLKKVHNAFYDK
jgi:hypothetical protein